MQADVNSVAPDAPLPPVAFIGGGNMAHAILVGAIDAGALDPDRVVVADPSPERRALFAHAVPSATEAVGWLAERESVAESGGPGQLVLAVKPQVFPRVAEELAGVLTDGPERVAVSIMAGTRSASIRSALGGRVRVVRAMPNTPAQVRRGVTAIALGAGALSGDAAAAETILRAVGVTVPIDEEMMDAFTGLAGSGPAYVFYLAEALAEAGEGVGFSPERARAIAEAVLVGSARLLEHDGRPAGELRRAVTSPNGTTQAGTETLDRLGVKAAVNRAVAAARDRGRELAGE
jgi:pyrroline-5-carboxylate reductase